MSVAMMCSTHTMVIPSSPRMRRSSSAAPAISEESRPPRLSSASSSFGDVASARASSSFLSPPAPSVAVDASSVVGRPTSAKTSRARARAAASPSRVVAPKCAATATFSTIDSLRNGRGIWNVRARPRWQMASGVRPAMSSSRKRTEPADGASAPEMQLNAVVLPEPFGPMSPRISPSRTSNETPLSAVKSPKRFVSPETVSTARGELGPEARVSGPPRVRASACQPGRRCGQHDGRVRDARDHRRIDVLQLAVDDLVHGSDRAHVLTRHRVVDGMELHAVALHRAALGNVRLARRLRERIGAEAAVLGDRARQHVVQQDPHIIEAHRDVWRDLTGWNARLENLVTLEHLLRELADAGLELLGIDQLRRRRIDGVKALHVVAERLLELRELAVAGAVPDVDLHAQPLFLRLAQEEGDVRVVAGVEQHVGPLRAQLRHERGQVGRLDRIALLENDLHALLLGFRLVGGGDTGAIGAVLIDDGGAHVLGRFLELVLRVVPHVRDGVLAE